MGCYMEDSGDLDIDSYQAWWDSTSECVDRAESNVKRYVGM